MRMDLRKKAFLQDPKTGRIYGLPKRPKEEMEYYPCDDLVVKDLQTRKIHGMPKSVPIFMSKESFGKSRLSQNGGEFSDFYIIPIPEERCLANLFNHYNKWFIQSLSETGEVSVNGEVLEYLDMRRLRDFSRIKAGEKEFRAFYRN